MKFELLVALRYLRSPNKPAVLRLITALSIFGIAAGVATLVVALAMNSGFRQALQDRLLGATAHISLSSASGGIRDYRGVMEKTKAATGVRAASPAIYQTVLLSSGGKARGIVLKGVEPALEQESNEVLTRDVAGQSASTALESRFRPDPDGIPAILVGRTLLPTCPSQPSKGMTGGRVAGSIPRSRAAIRSR